MRMPSSRWWWDLSTREFTELDMASIVAVLPVGAVEQHGPHLPVRVDAAINAGIVARAVELLPDDLPVAGPAGAADRQVQRAPGLSGHAHPALRPAWPALVRGRQERLAGRHPQLILWNSHGGQPQVMEIVCRELRVELGMFAVGASWFRTIDSSDLYSSAGAPPRHPRRRIRDQRHAASPSRARGDGACGGFRTALGRCSRRTAACLTPEGGVGFGWQAQDLHPAGVAGNAAAADARAASDGGRACGARRWCA